LWEVWEFFLALLGTLVFLLVFRLFALVVEVESSMFVADGSSMEGPFGLILLLGLGALLRIKKMREKTQEQHFNP